MSSDKDDDNRSHFQGCMRSENMHDTDPDAKQERKGKAASGRLHTLNDNQLGQVVSVMAPSAERETAKIRHQQAR